MNSFVNAARQAWGEDIPDWIVHLAMECDSSSQRAVGQRLGRSGSLVSQVLKGTYSADLTSLEERVRGAFMNGVLTCPALGILPANECQDWRKKSKHFVNVNALRVKMFKACRSCPRNSISKGADHARTS